MTLTTLAIAVGVAAVLLVSVRMLAALLVWIADDDDWSGDD